MEKSSGKGHSLPQPLPPPPFSLLFSHLTPQKNKTTHNPHYSATPTPAPASSSSNPGLYELAAQDIFQVRPPTAVSYVYNLTLLPRRFSISVLRCFFACGWMVHHQTNPPPPHPPRFTPPPTPPPPPPRYTTHQILAHPRFVGRGWSLHVSFYEIYGGKLFDLLNRRAAVRCLEDARQQVGEPLYLTHTHTHTHTITHTHTHTHNLTHTHTPIPPHAHTPSHTHPHPYTHPPT